MTFFFNLQRVTLWLLLTGTVFLINACAPATTGLAPSVTVKAQLDDLRRLQNQQTIQLQKLQAQLQQLEQRLTAGGLETRDREQISESATVVHQPPVKIPEPRPQPLERPAVPEHKVDIAVSATVYREAFSALASGRWAEAETRFNSFLRDYSDHEFSPNARYWLALSQLSQENLEAAKSNLRRIVIDPASQAKAPAALTQLAHIYHRQGLNFEADDVLSQLRSRYPESREAKQLQPHLLTE